MRVSQLKHYQRNIFFISLGSKREVNHLISSNISRTSKNRLILKIISSLTKDVADTIIVDDENKTLIKVLHSNSLNKSYSFNIIKSKLKKQTNDDSSLKDLM